jgi:hypothetical protein
MKLEMEGMDQLQGTLRFLREASISTAAKKAAQRGARVMAAEQRSRAPVLDQKTAGSTSLNPRELKESIRVYIRQMPDGIIRAFIGPAGYNYVRVAHLVEYGHRLVKGGKSRVGILGASGPGHEIGEVPEHPFLRTAYETSWQQALDAVAEEFRDWLKGAGQLQGYY